MAKFSAKARKFNSNDDLISRLPDDVLARVLSFVHPKSAVATSVLSRRWRYVWTCSPKLIVGNYTCSDIHNYTSITRSLATMPMFRNMIHLTLQIDSEEHWQSLTNIFHSSPKLVVFNLLNKSSVPCTWYEPGEVPHCFSSYLKIVYILSDFASRGEGEMQMISYLCKNALVLDKLFIQPTSSNLLQEAIYLGTLCRFRRRCIIKFIEYEDPSPLS